MKSKKAIFIFTSYIPTKSMAALKNSGINIFYLLPIELGEILENLKLDYQDIDEEILKKRLQPIFDWIIKTVDKDKKNWIIVFENFSIKINYYLYDFIKNNNLKLEEDIN